MPTAQPATDVPTAARSLFISYSHDSEGHRGLVAALAAVLRAANIPVVFDQHGPPPPEGWDVWAMREMASATAILVFTSRDYREFFEKGGARGVGRGAAWEAQILRGLLAQDRFRDRLFVVRGDGDDPDEVTPVAIRGRHSWQFPEDQEEILACLGPVFDHAPPRLDRWTVFWIFARIYKRYAVLLAAPVAALALWRNPGDQLAQVALSTWTHPMRDAQTVVVALPPFEETGPWRLKVAALLRTLHACRPRVLVLDADIRGEPGAHPELAGVLAALASSDEVAFVQGFIPDGNPQRLLAPDGVRRGAASLAEVASVVVGIDATQTEGAWQMDVAALAAPGAPVKTDTAVHTPQAMVRAQFGLVLAPLPAALEVIPWEAVSGEGACPPEVAGRVVYVGGVAKGADDKTTPRGVWPGVKVHAGIYEAMRFDAEIRTLSGILDAAASVVAIVVTFATRRQLRRPRLAGWVAAFAWLTVIVAMGTIGGRWLGFSPCLVFLAAWTYASWRGGR